MHRNPLAALLALPLLLAGALLPQEAGVVPGKPGKPEVIPFVTGNGTFNAYFLVKWTPSNPKPNNKYHIQGGEASIAADYSKDVTQGKLMPNAPRETLENCLRPSPGVLKSLAMTGESECYVDPL